MPGRYVLFDYQVLIGQEALNVYAYESFDSGSSAEELAAEFLSNVIPDLLLIQSVEVTHNAIQVLNLDDVTDFHTELIVQQGVLTGNCLPPYDAWAFFYIRANRATRNGHKRIAGVAESSQLNGVAESTFTTTLQGVASVLAGTRGETRLYLPRIWRRRKVGPGGTIIWDDSFHPISGVNARLQVSTQTSRKIGRGA